MWQVSDALLGLIGEAPEFDLHYIRAWTLRLDFWILIRTLAVFAGSRPLKSLAEIPRWTGSRSASTLEAAA